MPGREGRSVGEIETSDGRTVTDTTIETWAESLDRDRWPEGWVNVGAVVDGEPPVRRERTVTLTVRVPPAVKMALEARETGETTSAMARRLLEEALAATRS